MSSKCTSVVHLIPVYRVVQGGTYLPPGGRDIIPEIQLNGIINRKLLKNLDLSPIPATQKMSI
jgi:hypothetical protein